jgi:hypothetical protein
MFFRYLLELLTTKVTQYPPPPLRATARRVCGWVLTENDETRTTHNGMGTIDGSRTGTMGNDEGPWAQTTYKRRFGPTLVFFLFLLFFSNILFHFLNWGATS